MFNNAQMVEIGGKEVKSIVLQDGGVLYEKENIVAEPLILHFTGQQFQIYRHGLMTGNNIIIDWGDGSITNYDVNASNAHTYEEDTEHIITISNVTGLAGSFSGISGITDVIIPNTITSIGNGTFYSTSLSNVFIPSSVTYLGQGVFSNTPINNVVLSEGLKSIDATCFTNCPNLNKIIIPFSVTSLGEILFGGTPMKDIIFLWDSSETIIPYNESVYQGITLNNHTFNIPEGTTQLYVDKGYPLEKLVEGATSITLTSDKDIVGAGETAIITGTLNYPSQDKIVAFNTKTPESVTMTPGNNYYSIGENGFDITDFSNAFFLTSNIDNGYYLYVSYYGASNGEKALSVFVRTEDGTHFPALVNKLRYPIKLHIDENNIITYRYKDYEEQEVICLVKNLSNYRYLDEYTKEEGFTQWQLSGENSLTITKNTGLSTLTDSNGQATMAYEGVEAGYITITGTYLDKNVSDDITIYDGETTTPIEEVYLISLQTNKTILSAKNNDSCILNATVLDDNNNPVENQEVTFKNGTTILDTILTDENGEAAYEYISRGLGDISIKAEINSLSSNTITIEDCFETISSPNRTGFGTSWHPKPLEITGKVATNGPWGGTRIYGGDGQNINIHYVFLSQNSSNSGESEQIRYNLTTTAYVPFKIIIDENKISLWMNSSLYSEKALTTSEYVYMSGGSSANPVSLSDIKIKSLLGGNSLSLTSDKSTLSYIDNDFCTLTATYKGVSINNKPITFKINDKIVKTTTTNSEGIAEYKYISRGIGDLVVTAECGELQKTYELQDCIRYDSASSDKTSSYASPIVYRGSGSGQWNYDSANGYYGTISGSNEVMIPLNELTGEDDFTIEFDALFNSNSDRRGIGGICAYEDNNNYSRLSCHGSYIAQRVSVNGSATENETAVSTSINKGDLLHFKFTISNNQIVEEVTKGTTSVGTKTINYTPTNNTKYGLAFVWQNSWVSNTFLKNIKVKPLPFNGSMSISVSKDILSYADNDSCTLTATLTGDDVANKPIVFKNGNTVLDTVNTDSNGVATYTYSSQGAGDVTFTVECMNLQETYSIQDYLQIPTLNGDNIYQINGTTTVSNGEMSGGSAYLSLGFDNTGDWELNCKFKINGRNCALSLFPNGATAREQNELGMSAYRTNTFWFNNGTFVELYTSNRDLSGGNWYDVKITKQNGVLTTLIDGVTRTISNWDILSSASSFHIGVSGWGTNYNTATIKDVVVKPL